MISDAKKKSIFFNFFFNIWGQNIFFLQQGKKLSLTNWQNILLYLMYITQYIVYDKYTDKIYNWQKIDILTKFLWHQALFLWKILLLRKS